MRRRTKQEEEVGDYLILNGLKWDRENLYAPVGTVSGIRESGRNSYFTFNAAQAAAALHGKRCPTREEFIALVGLGYSIDYSRGGFWFGTDHSLQDKSVKSLFFPFRGAYNHTGNLEQITNTGVYWSSSLNSNYNGYNLNMGYDTVVFLYPANTSTTEQGFSVRCVRD